MLIRDLKWYLAVVEHGHVTDAAAVLGTSQPTLSRTLARLESELGARLLTRTPQGVHPTLAGEAVAAAAREIVDRLRLLKTEVQTLQDPESGVVRLAFLDSIATSVVPKALAAFHDVAPRVRVVLRQEPAHAIVADLQAGTVDVAIMSPRPPGPIDWFPLQHERLVLVVPPGHELRDRHDIRLEELADEEIVTAPQSFGYRVLVDSLLRDAGVAPGIAFESQDLGTIEGLVSAGLGVAIVPEVLAGSSGTRGIRILDEGAHRTIGLAWRSDVAPTPSVERFLDVARSLPAAPDDR